MAIENGDTKSARESNDLDREVARPSNERLLCTAFVSFMTFAIAQTIAAFVAGSEALMGDSAAMTVDALTYLFNWYAERQKKAYKDKLKGNTTGKALLEYRKYTYQLELIPPLLSVSTLLVVTGFVLNKAIQVLILDAKRDISLQADPNVELMMLFSCLNLLLDFLNVFCFAKAKHALGFETNPDEDQDDDRRKVTTMRSLLDDDDLGSRNSGDLSIVSQDDDEDDDEVASGRAKLEPLEIEDSNCVTSDRHDDEEANLNMCSAYTHVFADTLRSIAVIIASLLAEFIPAITSEEADATAAVVVSVLIILSLLPLFSGMIHTFRALRRVEVLLNEEALNMDVRSYDDEGEEDDWL